ncbi:MAG: hypothetical protein ACRDD8_10980 [Bacteroidales bacterium]
MLAKIYTLKDNIKNNDVAKSLCESAIKTLESIQYTGISEDARYEITNSVLGKMFEGLNEATKADKQAKSLVETALRLYRISNIGVRDSINSIIINEGASHPTLSAIIGEWKKRLSDTTEAHIYESYVADMAKFDYIPSVDKSIKAITENVNAYGNDIVINRIMGDMKKSNSAYLVPIIEDLVNNYIVNKTKQNASFLKESLIKFSHDAFIRQILDVVSKDVDGLCLESSNARNTIETIYSPILMLENEEVLFNVKGDYYTKKGNNINRVAKKDINKLDESFVRLCNVLNSDGVEIYDKHVRIYRGNDMASVNESHIEINNKKFLKDDIFEGISMYDKSGITNVAKIISESFNDIAVIDFVNRISIKENANYYADIFKLRDKVYITTADLDKGKKTFYRGVTPLQARNIIMEHMSHDISSIFESVLPAHNKIIKDINSTKKSYEDLINLLESKLDKFNKLESCNEAVNNITAELLMEIKSVKDDYKVYLLEAEKYLKPTNVSEDYISEGFTITVRDDKTGTTQSVLMPDSNQTFDSSANSQLVGQMDNTQVQQQPSNITYDESDSEHMSLEDGDGNSKVELPVDVNDVEAEAEEVEQNNQDDAESNNSEEGDLSPSSENDESDDEPKKKKLVVDKDIEESVQKTHKGDLNESELCSKVKYGNGTETGFVIGQDRDFNFIVLKRNGSTTVVKRVDVVDSNVLGNSLADKTMKFDKVSQKLLMEQLVKCGIYHAGVVPVKTSGCLVKLSEWYDADSNKEIKVLVEGRETYISKSNIKLHEEINSLASIDNYKEAIVVIDGEPMVAYINVVDMGSAVSGNYPVKYVTSDCVATTCANNVHLNPTEIAFISNDVSDTPDDKEAVEDVKTIEFSASYDEDFDGDAKNEAEAKEDDSKDTKSDDEDESKDDKSEEKSEEKTDDEDSKDEKPEDDSDEDKKED